MISALSYQIKCFLAGSDNCNQDEGNWNKINGKLQQISAGFSGVWGVNSNGDIFYRSGTFGDNKVIGSGWEKVNVFVILCYLYRYEFFETF